MLKGKGDELLDLILWEKYRSKADCRLCGGTGKEIDHRKVGLDMMAARKAAGLTLRELGKRVHLSAGYLHDLEHNRRAWSRSLFFAVDAAIRRHFQRMPSGAP